MLQTTVVCFSSMGESTEMQIFSLALSFADTKKLKPIKVCWCYKSSVMNWMITFLDFFSRGLNISNTQITSINEQKKLIKR